MSYISEVIQAARATRDILPLSQIAEAGLLRDRDNYFLNISYPSMQAMSSMAPASIEDKYRARIGKRPIALYVHVPFCSGLCHYCHYYKIIGRNDQVDKFLDCISIELQSYRKLSSSLFAESVYIGGGTPSSLTPGQICRLFKDLRTNICVEQNAEVTFEVHPEHATASLFETLKSVGVTRINIGVESFDDKILASENRRHTVEQAIEAILRAQSCGFDNLNIDLIYGLPYQSAEGWLGSIISATNLVPASVCAYYLRIKETTPLFKTYLNRPQIFPSEEEILLMHLLTLEHMKRQGYQQHIVDWFFRKPEYFHRYQAHNWQLTDEVSLLGLGPSAYSYVDGIQYYNVNDLNEYCKRVEALILPINRGEALTSTEERLRRSLMLGLKCGLDRVHFFELYGVDAERLFRPEFERLQKLGLVCVTANSITLTPYGSLFADEIGQMFYSESIRERMQAVRKTLISTTLPHRNPILETNG